MLSFLFLYMDYLSMESHMRLLEEFYRLSNEVQIFLLMDVNANQSPYFDSVNDSFKDGNFLDWLYTSRLFVFFFLLFYFASFLMILASFV
jgi:hypothetical protein